MRPGGDITAVGDRAVVPTGAHVLSPGMDVTPADLIRALITEHGVVEQPYGDKLSRMVAVGPGDATIPEPSVVG
jgi:methylthioribose-1-phosphate isomerase